jgi:hypothetical protein
MTTRPTTPRALTAPALAAAACCAAASTAAAQPTAELEVNNSKFQANVRNSFADGLVATGTTTGNSTQPSGTTSIDYFRLNFSRPGPPDLRRYRLLLDSATPGHTLTIRGLQQTGGAILLTSDVPVQTGRVLTGTTRFVQFYARAQPADLYFAVAGTPTTTAPYSVTLTSEVVPVIDLGVFQANTPLTITTVGQGHSTDTEIRLLETGLGNDDAGPGTQQSTFVFTPISGTFFFAVSDFNLADNRASVEAGEFFRDGNVLDFPGALLCSSPLAGVDVSFLVTDGTRTRTVFALKQGPFDAVFARFSVADLVCPADFDNSGTINPDDLADFIACYFTVPPCPTTDFDSSGAINPDDLADFIAAFFNTADGCPR